MASLREQLARKRAHTETRTYPIGDEGAAALAEVNEAQQAVFMAKMAPGEGKDKAVRAAQQRLKKAQTAYAELSLTLRIRGLTGEELDALESAHPPTEKQEADEKEKGIPEEKRSTLNPETFLPAALAVCVLDSDLTEEEWSAELASDRWAAGEVSDLFSAIYAATRAEPGPGIPKG